MKLKLKSLAKAAALGAVATLLVACGGGGGGGSVAGSSGGGGGTGDTGGRTASLQVSGTAATGAALANAAVEVKCAAGSGSTTTSATGTYSVAMSGAALPCIVRVTAGGGTIVLHSVAETGSTAGGNTSAIANVTPVTELVLAQLSAALPGELFAAFDAAAGAQITGVKLAGATSAVLSALKNAGIDLGAIDPFKAQLVAASTSTSGNAYDQQLDALGRAVPPPALPLLATQVANASASQSTTALDDAMAAVQGGALPNCSHALSGKYRTIDYFGKAVVRDVNFKAATFQASTASDQMTIVQDTTNPCAFTASALIGGQRSEWQVAFGPGGVGVYRSRFTSPSVTPGVVGYIFPVQTHGYAELAGTWTNLQSGLLPGASYTHFPGQMTFNADRTVVPCDYAPGASWNCVVDTDSRQTISDRGDGGFNLDIPGKTGVANLYGFRSPAGTLTFFGTSNASGATTSDVLQTSMVLVKPTALPLPVVNTTTRYAETQVSVTSARTTTPVVNDAVTVLSVDAASGTVTRRRESDARLDTLHYNAPVAGWRKRDQGTDFAAAYQLVLPGLGLTATINTETNQTTHFFSLSANRP